MALGTKMGLSPGDLVLDRDPTPLPKKGRSPQFSAHVYCGHTAGRIKMPLGTQVGLSPGDIVLDGDRASPKRGTAPNFRPVSIVAKRLHGSRCYLVQRYALAQTTLWWMGSQLPLKGAQLPVFGPCLLWPNG